MGGQCICVFWCALVCFGEFWLCLSDFGHFYWYLHIRWVGDCLVRLTGCQGALRALSGAGQSPALCAARAQRAQQRPVIGTDNVGCAGDGLLRWAGRPVGATARAQRGAGLRTQRAAAGGGV